LLDGFCFGFAFSSVRYYAGGESVVTGKLWTVHEPCIDICSIVELWLGGT